MPYLTIKELVIDAYVSEGEMPGYEALTLKVREHFPTSGWQRSHYSWYKSQINTGRINVGTDAAENAELDLVDEEITDSIEFGVSLEKDIHNYLAHNIHKIEQGLTVVPDGIEYAIEAGRIDILAKDSLGNLVVIELKAGKAGDAALGQLLGYMGYMACRLEGG